MFSSIHLIADATLATESVAQAVTAEQLQNVGLTASNIWMLVSTMLVFIMALGFACVEAGFTQAKNTVNILFKNTVDLSVGIISYAWFGFNLMYPGEFNGIFGFAGWGLSLPEGYTSLGYAGGAYTYWTDFLFQAMFAATCATIVSGAVAERIKISAYFIFTFFLVGFIYPVLGSWHWGGGWLSEMGFYDFAGSTVVHSVGGWAALAGIIAIGARKGKYVNGKVIDKPGSSVPLAVIGVFLLWFGWFGFNGGSVLSADPESISLVLVTTTLAAAAGAIGGWLGGYIAFKRFDLGMVLNGILAGLVGITAGADQMSPNEAILIGIVCGVVVVFSAIGMDKLKLDDCVGAVSVHLTCGIIGTLALGVLGQKAGMSQFITQLTGVAAYGAVAFFSSLAIFYALKFTIGVRVSEEHENEGLDSHEHGIRGYTITFDN
ncbi:ammonium transporter [Flammeovirga sp. MY04]|uniref:ammonium transporter n=1 Tax=Flammeovirga sp. MY04 TaxID=1191459 RepID=UPI0008063AAA|nr:ammonium transporter [Flammeovirga sp. MY04]ANQ51349.1 ammonium transporter [Flammeovirga sp. MY04]